MGSTLSVFCDATELLPLPPRRTAAADASESGAAPRGVYAQRALRVRIIQHAAGEGPGPEERRRTAASSDSAPPFGDVRGPRLLIAGNEDDEEEQWTAAASLEAMLRSFSDELVDFVEWREEDGPIPVHLALESGSCAGGVLRAVEAGLANTLLRNRNLREAAPRAAEVIIHGLSAAPRGFTQPLLAVTNLDFAGANLGDTAAEVLLKGVTSAFEARVAEGHEAPLREVRLDDSGLTIVGLGKALRILLQTRFDTRQPERGAPMLLSQLRRVTVSRNRALAATPSTHAAARRIIATYAEQEACAAVRIELSSDEAAQGGGDRNDGQTHEASPTASPVPFTRSALTQQVPGAALATTAAAPDATGEQSALHASNQNNKSDDDDDDEVVFAEPSEARDMEGDERWTSMVMEMASLEAVCESEAEQQQSAAHQHRSRHGYFAMAPVLPSRVMNVRRAQASAPADSWGACGMQGGKQQAADEEKDEDNDEEKEKEKVKGACLSYMGAREGDSTEYHLPPYEEGERHVDPLSRELNLCSPTTRPFSCVESPEAERVADVELTPQPRRPPLSTGFEGCTSDDESVKWDRSPCDTHGSASGQHAKRPRERSPGAGAGSSPAAATATANRRRSSRSNSAGRRAVRSPSGRGNPLAAPAAGGARREPPLFTPRSEREPREGGAPMMHLVSVTLEEELLRTFTHCLGEALERLNLLRLTAAELLSMLPAAPVQGARVAVGNTLGHAMERGETKRVCDALARQQLTLETRARDLKRRAVFLFRVATASEAALLAADAGAPLTFADASTNNFTKLIDDFIEATLIPSATERGTHKPLVDGLRHVLRTHSRSAALPYDNPANHQQHYSGAATGGEAAAAAHGLGGGSGGLLATHCRGLVAAHSFEQLTLVFVQCEFLRTILEAHNAMEQQCDVQNEALAMMLGAAKGKLRAMHRNAQALQQAREAAAAKEELRARRQTEKRQREREEQAAAVARRNAGAQAARSRIANIAVNATSKVKAQITQAQEAAAEKQRAEAVRREREAAAKERYRQQQQQQQQQLLRKAAGKGGENTTEPDEFEFRRPEGPRTRSGFPEEVDGNERRTLGAAATSPTRASPNREEEEAEDAVLDERPEPRLRPLALGSPSLFASDVVQPPLDEIHFQREGSLRAAGSQQQHQQQRHEAPQCAVDREEDEVPEVHQRVSVGVGVGCGERSVSTLSSGSARGAHLHAAIEKLQERFEEVVRERRELRTAGAAGAHKRRSRSRSNGGSTHRRSGLKRLPMDECASTLVPTPHRAAATAGGCAAVAEQGRAACLSPPDGLKSKRVRVPPRGATVDDYPSSAHSSCASSSRAPSPEAEEEDVARRCVSRARATRSPSMFAEGDYFEDDVASVDGDAQRTQRGFAAPPALRATVPKEASVRARGAAQQKRVEHVRSQLPQPPPHLEVGDGVEAAAVESDDDDESLGFGSVAPLQGSFFVGALPRPTGAMPTPTPRAARSGLARPRGLAAHAALGLPTPPPLESEDEFFAPAAAAAATTASQVVAAPQGRGAAAQPRRLVPFAASTANVPPSVLQQAFADLSNVDAAHATSYAAKLAHEAAANSTALQRAARERVTRFDRALDDPAASEAPISAAHPAKALRHFWSRDVAPSDSARDGGSASSSSSSRMFFDVTDDQENLAPANPTKTAAAAPRGEAPTARLTSAAAPARSAAAAASVTSQHCNHLLSLPVIDRLDYCPADNDGARAKTYQQHLSGGGARIQQHTDHCGKFGGRYFLVSSSGEDTAADCEQSEGHFTTTANGSNINNKAAAAAVGDNEDEEEFFI